MVMIITNIIIMCWFVILINNINDNIAMTFILSLHQCAK